MFDTLPGYGLYCRHVEGIRFDGIDVAWEESDERPAMVFDDVAGLEIELTSILDLDLSVVWDRIQTPQARADGSIPEQDDFRILFGVSLDI